MNSLISINVIAHNEERYIKKCISSLLNQNFKNFELIIVDDGSTDNTLKIIREFKDLRIKCIENTENQGIGKSRNIAISNSIGDYIFFTDADCVVKQNWLTEGLKCFEKGCLGVEGRLIYVSEEYEPTFSTLFLENETGGHFLTGNVAYRADVIKSIGGFNENLAWFKDRDLGLRMANLGKIFFNKNMVVIHPVVFWTPNMLIKSAKRIQARVYLFKEFGDRNLLFWRIMEPLNLAKILFPPLILMGLFFSKFISREDFVLLPFTYFFVILERYYIWKACCNYKVFLI